MKIPLLRSLPCLFALGFLAPAASADPAVKFERHEPYNLFDLNEDVRFKLQTKEIPQDSEITVVLADELGKEIARKTVKNVSGKAEVNLGKPGRGYFDAQASAALPGGKTVSGKVSLGVLSFVNRTAAQVRDGKYVFGIKWWGGIQRQEEFIKAMEKMGMQWTRFELSPAKKFLPGNEINAVVKVDRFQPDAYDEKRYGPMEDYETQYGKGSWTVKTVPKKAEYQKALREIVQAIPKEQKVFEIWNEPWDKMSPQEFAEICNMAAEAILQVRPDAIVGPNLAGLTGKYDYDAAVIEAGGMKQMKMVALHPYAGSEDREWVQEYKAWLKEKLGMEPAIYITEYGSHSTPEGPQKQSEMQQARQVGRRSIVIYSHGVGALIPHIAKSAETVRTYWDDWLGFMRKNEEIKPVMVVHANAARMIDGSTHAGDLWFGPQVEALVFDRKGEKTLVLWTRNTANPTKEENTARKQIELTPDSNSVLLTDMFGREKTLTPRNGKIELTLDEAPIYLTGFGPGLLTGMTKELRADRWPKPEKPPKRTRQAAKLPKAPVFDGNFDDWANATQVAHVNEAVNAKDASGAAYIAWDENYLYYGSRVKDNEVYNPNTRNKLYRGDSIELFISTEPRDSGGGFGPRDHQFILTPISPDGIAVIAEMTERESGRLEDLTDGKFFAGPTKEGWAIELAIPWSRFKGFEPKPGAQLALDMRLNDEDKAHKRWKLDPGDAPNFDESDPTSWSNLELKD